ncbi:MAG: FtsW/RodA/SpoVE family cell cycle protein [Candidatus Rhabdochlamydia sp.]
MFDYRYMFRVDLRVILILLALMSMSILVITSMTSESDSAAVMTSMGWSQIQWFILGWVVFFFFVGTDYRKLRPWAGILYGIMIMLLLGLFLTTSIQNVHRWYRIPGLGRAFQPSEYTKLVVVITLSAFLEMKEGALHLFKTAFEALIIVFIPFILILKEPDLGTALVLYPIALVMFYLGGIQTQITKWLTILGMSGIAIVTLIFTGIISHEAMRPIATQFLKEYQYERLNPHTYHQQASQTAISLGGVAGRGWLQGDFSGKGWLPAAHTDSVFAAFTEEFGVMGVFFLLLCFFSLIYFSFQVTAGAKDPFGRFLSAGISTYLAMQVVVNIGMMVGFLPITGIPLILITYGGSSVVSCMMAFGILQSIYSRRYIF